MKTILKISLLANLIALVGVAFLLTSRNSANQKHVDSTAGLSIAAASTPPIIPVTRPESMAESHLVPVASPFQWKQLYSSDYHIYVRNLRATGCPEPTVRAIVSADVDSVYQLLANQMEKKLLAMESDPWSKQVGSYNSEFVWRAELQKIPDEESAKIADLLGLKLAPAEVAVATPRHTRALPASPTGPLPLALQDVDLSTLNLNAEEKQLIISLRQQFLQQVGDPVQDQTDPAYLARLKKAQPEMDGLLKAMIGNTAFANYQLEVMNSRAGPAAP